MAKRSIRRLDVRDFNFWIFYLISLFFDFLYLNAIHTIISTAEN